MRRAALLALAACCAAALHAQQRGRLPEVSATLKGDLQLPIPFRNPLFTAYTENIGQVALAYQHPLYNGLGIGAGGGLWWSALKERALQPFVPPGEVRRAIAFGKMQYERYTGPVTFHEFSLRAGAAWYWFDCATCSGAARPVPFWGVGWGFYLHATDNLAFGFTAAYDRAARTFAATDLGLARFPDRRDIAEARPAQNLLLGLAFSTRLRPSPREPVTW